MLGKGGWRHAVLIDGDSLVAQLRTYRRQYLANVVAFASLAG